jgi:hypothetical protein
MINWYNTYTVYAKIPIDKVEKIDFVSMAEPLETMESYYNRQTRKPDFQINGGYFSWVNGKPILTYKDENQYIVNESMYVGIGIFDDKLLYGDSRQIGYRDFISGFPTLVKDGHVEIGHRTDFSRDMRSALGYNDTHYFLLACDGRQKDKFGATHEELAQIMIDIGCKFAINLDGGGSTKLMHKGQAVNSPTENRAIDNSICVYLKEETMEWKEPNWNWIWTKYAQVDKDGKVKVQNNDMNLAIGNAKVSGYAVWEKATKKRVYPKEVLQNVTETEKPMLDLTQLKKLATNLETRTVQLKSALDELLNHLKELEK